ncbi:MAG: glycosyltransferase family 2 protein, partial [SAR324 cluster bacterium]|nr:glycosyltransferase family 2 protein [SAR324 cluster bacterium]
RVIDDFRYPFRDRLDVYEFTENQFFVKPNNFVINQYKDSDIVLMNDDIEIIDDHWLCNLFDAAYISPFIGAAGGKILSADRKISEAGGEMYKNGRGRNLGRGAEADSPEFNFQRYVGFVSGCLLYMKRSAIEQCGMLDEDFHPMYYEDVAWQYTLHMAGLKTIYEPSCTVIHREGSTAGTDVNSGMKRFQEINRSKFLEKFSGINIEEYNHQ